MMQRAEQTAASSTATLQLADNFLYHIPNSWALLIYNPPEAQASHWGTTLALLRDKEKESGL